MAVRAFFLGAVLIGILAGGSIASVRLIAGSGNLTTPATTPAEPTPTPEPEVDSPEWLVSTYIARWRAGDFSGLYDLLDAQAQGAHSRDVFVAAYTNFNDELRRPRVRAEASAITERGATLDVNVSTAYFGALEYTMQLPFTRNAEGELRVSWTPANLHPDLLPRHTFTSSLEFPRRGSVFDRNGEVLAETRDIRYLGLNRSVITDREPVSSALIEFGFSQEAIDAAFASPLGQNQRVPVGVVGDDRIDAAADLNETFPGLLIWFEQQRAHPLGPAAAHVIGYTRELTAEELEARRGLGYQIGDRIGAMGLERTMNNVLAGTVGATLDIVDPAGGLVMNVFTREFEDGQDITTTLDAHVLRTSYQVLGDRAGASVVIDPRTNELLALNSSPSFDPGAFERGDSAAVSAIFESPDSPFTNRAVDGLYAAGSTFKLITGAAGLVDGGFSPADTIFCGATWDGVDPPRRNWEGAQGPLTIARGLQRSCNPVFYEIALHLYNTTDSALSEMARAFGFGSSVGTRGIQDEAGLVPDAEWKSRVRGESWFPGDEVNLGIGQGDLLITPIQLANAYSAFITNELRTPVLVQGDVAESRGVLPLSEAQAAHLRSGLEMVTAAGGTAGSVFAAQGYHDFAGKSGTAEDANEQQHVLFVAYAPRANPQAVAAVILDEGESGSIEVGPISRDLVLAAIR